MNKFSKYFERMGRTVLANNNISLCRYIIHKCTASKDTCDRLLCILQGIHNINNYWTQCIRRRIFLGDTFSKESQEFRANICAMLSTASPEMIELLEANGKKVRAKDKLPLSRRR